MKANKLFQRIISVFKCRCPECGGIMDSVLDTTLPYGGNLIYTCRECGKQWI